MPRLLVELWKACAVPWKEPCSPCGKARSRCTLLIDATASLSAVPGFRLKDTVTAGSWPRWLMLSGIVPALILVTALSGTSVGVEGMVGLRSTDGVVGVAVPLAFDVFADNAAAVEAAPAFGVR